MFRKTEPVWLYTKTDKYENNENEGRKKFCSRHLHRFAS